MPNKKPIANLLLFFFVFLLTHTAQAQCTDPTITEVLPLEGPVNTEVTIIGTGFSAGSGTTSIEFNGVAANDFTVISDIEIKATVPVAATEGTISITTDGCSENSPIFTVLESGCDEIVQDLYISELYDHNGGSLGYVELYNPKNVPVTFNGEYSLQRAGDVGGGIDYNSVLSGTIGAQETYIVRSGNGPGCTPPVDGVMGQGINANDQFFLRKNSAIIDEARAPGNIGYNVIRNPDAVAPSSTYSNADWTFINSENCDDLDQHTANPPAPTDVTVTQHPQDQVVVENGQAILSVAIDALDGFTYQWMVLDDSGNWVNVVDDDNHLGATSNTLIIVNIPLDFDGNQYYCEITSENCALVSNAAGLTVDAEDPTDDCMVTTVNPDFEEPEVADNSYSIMDEDEVPGWSTTAADGEIELWGDGFQGVPAYSGSQFVELNANTVGGLYQDYGSPEGTVFNYGFAHRGREGTDTCQLLAGPPGGPYENVGDPVSTDNSAWSYNTGTYTVPAGQPTTRFIFQSVSSAGADNSGNFLDDISFTANMGILTEGPVEVFCTGEVSLESVGGGTWVEGSGNPSSVTISDVNSNTITISGFSVPGEYTFEWTSAYCSDTITVIYDEEEVEAPQVTDVSFCEGSTGASLDVEPVTGHTVNWYEDNSGTVPLPQEPTVDTSTAGTTTYYLSQVNSDGCESELVSLTVIIVPNDDPSFTMSPTCTGATATVTGDVGGTFAFADQPTDGAEIDPDTGAITNGTSGMVYEVIYTTNGSCPSNSTESVTAEVFNVPVEATVENPSCSVATGSITVTSPLEAGLEYSIDGTNFQSGTEFDNLSPGTYNVTVQNTEGCISVSSMVINPAPDIPDEATTTVVHPTCNVATGSIMVTAPIGVGLEYSIDGGDSYQQGTDFVGLSPGTYTVTVQNGDDCTSETSDITIDAVPPGPAVADVAVTQPTCGEPTGSITVDSPTGAGLEYSIDGGDSYQQGTDFVGLSPGTYTVTVQNAADCQSVSANIVIDPVPNAPDPAQITVTQPTCANPEGSIEVTAPVGTGFEYSINDTDFQSDTVFDELPSGTYNLTVRDVNTDCTSVLSGVEVDVAPDVPEEANTTVTQPTCNALGTIVVTSPVGAGLEYSINGTDFQSDTMFGELPSGTYSVTVRNVVDNYNCISVSEDIVLSSAIAPEVTTVQECRDAKYILEALPVDGSFAVEEADYAWSDANGFQVGANENTFNVTEYVQLSSNSSASDFPATFTVEVTIGSCTASAEFLVEGYLCDIPQGISPSDMNGLNDNFNLSGLGVDKLTIYNRWGTEVYAKNNYKNEWHGQSKNGSGLPTGTYFYLIETNSGKTHTGWVYLNR